MVNGVEHASVMVQNAYWLDTSELKLVVDVVVVVTLQACCADVVACWTRRRRMYVERKTSRYGCLILSGTSMINTTGTYNHLHPPSPKCRSNSAV